MHFVILMLLSFHFIQLSKFTMMLNGNIGLPAVYIGEKFYYLIVPPLEEYQLHCSLNLLRYIRMHVALGKTFDR